MTRASTAFLFNEACCDVVRMNTTHGGDVTAQNFIAGEILAYPSRWALRSNRNRFANSFAPSFTSPSRFHCEFHRETQGLRRARREVCPRPAVTPSYHARAGRRRERHVKAPPSPGLSFSMVRSVCASRFWSARFRHLRFGCVMRGVP